MQILKISINIAGFDPYYHRLSQSWSRPCSSFIKFLLWWSSCPVFKNLMAWVKKKLKFFFEFVFVHATVFHKISGFVLYKCQKKTAEIFWSSVFLTNFQHSRRNLMNNYIYPIQYLMLRQNRFSLWIILSQFMWNDVMSEDFL